MNNQTVLLLRKKRKKENERAEVSKETNLICTENANLVLSTFSSYSVRPSQYIWSIKFGSNYMYRKDLI